MAGRITHLPMDSTDRASTNPNGLAPTKGEISVLTPKNFAEKRVFSVRDKTSGNEFLMSDGMERLQFSETVTGAAKAVFGPLTRPTPVYDKSEVRVVIGGVPQSQGVFSYCTNAGVAVTSGTATYIKIDVNVPVGVKVVIDYRAQLELSAMKPLTN